MYCEELKNGHYKFVERYQDPLTGKSRKISVVMEKKTRQSQKDAQQVLQERIREMLEDPFVKSKDYTLKDLSDLYSKHQKSELKVSTCTRNEFALASLLRMLGEDTLYKNLSAPFIRQRMQDSGKEPDSLNELLKRLKAMIRWAYAQDLIPDTRCVDKLSKFKAPPHRISIQDKYLDSEELKKVVDQMSVQQWKLLTQFLALSGLRFSEFCALEKRDVDLDQHVIHVNKGYDSNNQVVTDVKNVYSARDVHIQPELETVCNAINAYMSRRKLSHRVRSPLFMFDEAGHHTDYFAFNKYLRENCMKITGKRITVHALRHTHASILFEKGFTMDEIARRLGHGNSRITREIYVHVTEKLKEKDAEKLNAVQVF